MDQYNEREMQTNTPYNEGRGINFGSVKTPLELAATLKLFNEQVKHAKDAGMLDEDAAKDAQYHITQVIVQAGKPTTNKTYLLSHLTAAASRLAPVSVLALALFPLIELLGKISWGM